MQTPPADRSANISVAAIVCGHALERWVDIQRSIESIQDQLRPADEIVLSVDNNPELYDLAVSFFDPSVTVVHNTGVRGVSAARNAAVEATTSTIVAFLDDDATADPGWLQLLLRWYEDPGVAGVGGTANPAWDGGIAPDWFPPSFHWVVGCSHAAHATQVVPVRNFIGCNMSVRRDVWQRVGGFDVAIGRVGNNGAGGDETEFCMRVHEAHCGTILNDPDAVVTHRVPQSRQTWQYFFMRCRSEGKSKAALASSLVDGLDEERTHLTRTLPLAVLKGVGAGFTGDRTGPKQAAAIAAGTVAVGVSFLQHKLDSRLHNDRGFTLPSVQVLTVDIDLPEHEWPQRDATRPTFTVVRSGGHVLGINQASPGQSAAEFFEDLTTPYACREIVTREEAPRAPRPTAAVAIATRNRADSLVRCLESLTRMTVLPDQVVVIDNAPSDNTTRAAVHQWNETQSMQLAYSRCWTPGLAHAHNAALEIVDTEIVAFTDDDVIADPHWLEQIVLGFDTGEDVACVTGAIMPAELDTWPQQWVESSSRFTKGFDVQRFSLQETREDDPLFPFTAGSMGSGANMAFSMKWLRGNGGFDAALGAGTTSCGGDDLRAFYDVVTDNKAVIYTPHAVVSHHHHRTKAAIDSQAYGYGAGLGAFLASVIIHDPPQARLMLRHASKGRERLRSQSKPGDASVYPGQLRRTALHRIGLLSGPIRYLWSRRSVD